MVAGHETRACRPGNDEKPVGHMHSIFAPASPEAAAVTRLWWWMFGAGLIIWLGVATVAVRAALVKSGDASRDVIRDTPAVGGRVERIVIAAVLGTAIVPVGVPIHLRLASDDVIHSFWAPNLNGKSDLIPGYRSALWFLADTPGVYR